MEMLSDEGDLLSDEEEQSQSYISSGGGSVGDSNRNNERNIPSAADRRAHHNALERKRRDHIKDSFSSLRDAVPSLHGEKASRAQILKKAAEYIQYMRKKNSNAQNDIEEIRKKNKILEEQIRLKEQQRSGRLSATSTPTPSNLYSSVQSLSLMNSSSESANGVSPSYGDISENSNESSLNDLAMVNSNSSAGSFNGRLADSPSPSTASSNGGSGTGTNRNQQQLSPLPLKSQLLINGTAATQQTTTVRSATVVKNGSSTIIVQNPQQIKTVVANTQLLANANGGGGGPHVIHVTPNISKNIQINNSSNIAATATPIIISTSSLAAANNNNSLNGSANGNVIATNGNGGTVTNTYTVLNKSSGALSLTPATVANGSSGAFRTVVVQPASNNPQQLQIVGGSVGNGNTTATTTPNIHIVSAIPSTYTGRNVTTTKRYKISAATAPVVSTTINVDNKNINSTTNTSSSSTSVSGGTTIGTNNNNSTAKPQTFNVTSVSS